MRVWHALARGPGPRGTQHAALASSDTQKGHDVERGNDGQHGAGSRRGSDSLVPKPHRRSSRTELDPILGSTIANDFVIERPLGSGSHADVFLARQRSVGDRKVALKVLCRPYLSLRESDLRRAATALVREAAVLGQMRSPCFVSVHTTGQLADTRPYVVLEYVEGETLQAILARQRTLPASETVVLALQLAAGLAELHGLGHVHRDVTPANLLLGTGPLGEPRLKMIDFGTVTRISERADRYRVGYDLEHPLGTASYMAPEQARGDIVDGRADQFALAAIVYECLSGRRALEVGLPTQRGMLEFLRGDAPIPTVGPALVAKPPEAMLAVVLRALERDPARRYPDIRAFARSLRDSMQDDEAPRDGGGLLSRLFQGRGRG